MRCVLDDIIPDEQLPTLADATNRNDLLRSCTGKSDADGTRPRFLDDESTVRSDESTVRSDESTVRSDESTVRSDDSTVRSDDSTVRSDDSPVFDVDCTVRSADCPARTVDFPCCVRRVGRHATATGCNGLSTPTRATATQMGKSLNCLVRTVDRHRCAHDRSKRTAHSHTRADDSTDPRQRVSQTNR